MLEIKKHNEKILHKKTRAIEDINNEIKKLVDFMVKAMYQNQGVGLAANQIGLDLCMAVVDAGNGLKILINPKIIKTKGQILDDEGCLSLPGVFLKIKRPQFVEVEAFDKNGRSIKIKARDLEARAICHEVDHLNGKLITDRVGLIKKLRYKVGI